MSTSSTCLVAAGSRERLARADRLLALRNHGRDVAEDVRDAQAADVLREIAPVRSDVAERRRRAALVGLEPPRIVGVLEQPVLQVLADEKVRLADVAARNRLPRLLDERIAAIVERHGVDDAGLGRLIEQLLRFRRRHRQRLVGDDVLALGDGRGIDRDSAGSSAWRCERPERRDRSAALRSCRRPCARRAPPPFPPPMPAAARDRDDIDISETPHRVDVMGADKARTDDTHSDPFHVAPPLVKEPVKELVKEMTRTKKHTLEATARTIGAAAR